MRTRTRKPKARGALAKVKKAVTTLKRSIIPGANKYIYYPPANITTSLTQGVPLIFTINAVASGTTEVYRIGDKVRYLNLEMRLHIYRVLASIGYTQSVRVLLVREKTCLGSTIALAQYFNSSTPAVSDVKNYTSRDPSRFVTLYDKVIQLAPLVVSTAGVLTSSAGTTAIKDVVIKKKLNFITTYQRSDTGAVGDIELNSLNLIIITNNTVTSDISVQCSYNLTFDDN